MKCQLWDLQLLAIVELGDRCGSVFSKGQGVIISHLRRESQRVQGKESLLSETLIHKSDPAEKRKKQMQYSWSKGVSEQSKQLARAEMGLWWSPSHKPRAKVSRGGGFLLSEVPCQKRALCFGSAMCSSTLMSWKFPHCFLFPALPCCKDVLYMHRQPQGRGGMDSKSFAL